MNKLNPWYLFFPDKYIFRQEIIFCLENYWIDEIADLKMLEFEIHMKILN